MKPSASEHNTAIPDAKEQIIPSGSNLFKAIFLIFMLLASFYLTQRGAEHFDKLALSPWLKWLFIGLTALWDGVLLLGMAALAHDAVHRVLFRSNFWNEFWGGMLSALALIPFQANRQFHLAHHSHAHQPGLDPENQMHNHTFFVASTAGAFIGLFAQYRIFILNILRGKEGRYAQRALKDALFVTAAGLIYFYLLPAAGIKIIYTALPMILLFPIVFTWRALSDHYGVPAIVREPKNREKITQAHENAETRECALQRQEVSGWVVLTHPWLEWLWSHVNYHEVHHKYPYLSHHYLPQVFQATRHQHPYLVVGGYWKSILNLRRCKYYESYETVRRFLTIPQR